MDGEQVQAESSSSRRTVRRRRFELQFAFVIVGIVLIDIAVLGFQGSFSLTITAPPYGNLTVHCGTVANATSSVPTVELTNESRARLSANSSSAAYVVALEKLKNSCRIAGQLRFDGSVTAAVLGMVAVLTGLATSGRIKATSAHKGPAPPSNDRSPLGAGPGTLSRRYPFVGLADTRQMPLAGR